MVSIPLQYTQWQEEQIEASERRIKRLMLLATIIK